MATTPNPYDSSQGLLSGAMATPNTGVQPATTNGAAQLDTNAFAPGTQQPSQADVSNWDVNQDQTVQGQISKIIGQGSPLLDQAQTRANEKANSRGLLNSSMAVGAAESALYDAAMPIAQQDASTYANSAQYNAEAKNTTNRFNTSESNASQRQLTDLSFRGASQNAASQNEALRQQSDQASQLQRQQLDEAFKSQMQTADAATRVQLQTMQGQTQTDLANIEANYKTLMQTNASASELYQQTLKNITDIMMNKDLDSAAKQAAISQQSGLLGQGLAMIGQISNLNLGNILQFTAVPPVPPDRNVQPIPGGVAPGGVQEAGNGA